MKKFNGKQFRKRRLARGLSQPYVAKKAGVTGAYISLLERGCRNAMERTAQRLWKALE